MINEDRLVLTRLELQLQREYDTWTAYIANVIVHAPRSRDALSLPYELGKLDQVGLFSPLFLFYTHLICAQALETISTVRQPLNPPFRNNLNATLSPLNRDKGIVIYRPCVYREESKNRLDTLTIFF